MSEKNELQIEIQKLNSTINKLYHKHSLWRAFLNGVVTGLGSVIGATIVVAFFVFLLSRVQFIPVIGNWIGQIAAEAAKNLPNR